MNAFLNCCTVVGLILAGCDIHDYSPDTTGEPDPGASTSAFFIKPAGIKGVFGNSDVVSQVYTYVARVDSDDEFWKLLEAKVSMHDWRQLSDNGTRRYIRVTQPKPPRKIYTTCEVRVKFESVSRRVMVGWVYGDSETNPSQTDLPELEKQFADRRVWPLIERGIE